MTQNEKWVNTVFERDPTPIPPNIYWKSTVTEFLRRCDQSDEESQHSNTFKNSSIKGQLTREVALTEARKLIRQEQFEHLKHGRKDRVIDRQISEYKTNLENKRIFQRLQVKNLKQLPFLEEKNNHQTEEPSTESTKITLKQKKVINRCFSLSDITDCQKLAFPATSRKAKVDLKRENSSKHTEKCNIGVTSETEKKTVQSAKLSNCSIRVSLENLSATTFQPPLFEFSCKVSDETEAQAGDKDLEVKEEIREVKDAKRSGTRRKPGTACALRVKQAIEMNMKRYYWAKWKKYMFFTKAEKIEEQKWQKKIDNFMTRLDNRKTELKKTLAVEASGLKTKNESKTTKTKHFEIAPESSELTEITKAIEASTADTREQLKCSSVNNLDPQHRGKARLIRVMTETFNERKQQVKLKPFPQPKILAETEEKQIQRKQRIAEILERKRLIEEAKDRIVREKYERQLIEAIMEKRKKLVAFKEKMRKERIEQEKRKQEWLRLKLLTVKATHMYETRLLTRYGLIPWLKLVELRWEQMSKADEQNDRRIKRKYFICWKESVTEIQHNKEIKALIFWRRKLFKSTLESWREACTLNKLKWQAAEDWCDYMLVRRYLENWRDFVYIEQREMSQLWDMAIDYRKKKLTTLCLKHWMLLPHVLYLEREKEQRKRVLREKVQQILPDFRPNLELSRE